MTSQPDTDSSTPHYTEQWRTFEEAIALGWTGKKPSVLGTYAADKALESARTVIEEAQS